MSVLYVRQEDSYSLPIQRTEHRQESTRTTPSSIHGCLDVDVKRRRDIVKDRSRWMQELRRELWQGKGLRIAAEEKRTRWKEGN